MSLVGFAAHNLIDNPYQHFEKPIGPSFRAVLRTLQCSHRLRIALCTFIPLICCVAIPPRDCPGTLDCTKIGSFGLAQQYCVHLCRGERAFWESDLVCSTRNRGGTGVCGVGVARERTRIDAVNDLAVNAPDRAVCERRARLAMLSTVFAFDSPG